MTVALAAAGFGAATLVFWTIAARAAVRRCVSIGRLPPALLIVTLAGSGLVAGSATPALSAIAVAGAAVAAIVDLRTGSIFDPLSAAVLLAACGLRVFDGSMSAGAWGSLAVGSVLYALHAGTGGRGLGLGDVKLGAALGAALGAPAGLLTIALAFVLGGGYGVWLLASHRARRRSTIRFAPFIAAGTYAALIVPAAVRPW